jgi:D-glucuronyl C5-epimerase-like protein
VRPVELGRDGLGLGRHGLTTVRTAAIVVLVVSAWLLAATPVRASYSRYGPYAWTAAVPPDVNTVFTWPGVVRDAATGLPRVTYAGVVHWNAVTISLYGLQEFSRYRLYGHRQSLLVARRAGDWLVSHQLSNGVWLYRYLFEYPRLGYVQPGWVAAQAQGNAISLLVRLYVATRQRAYLNAARRARTVFQRNVGNSGVRRVLAGHVLFEGFPTVLPTFALEDLQLAILGLYDLMALDPTAGKLARKAMAALSWALPLYDDGLGHPLFDLAHRAAGVTPLPGPESASFNAHLLALLARRFHDDVARFWAARWLANNPG